MKVGWMVAGRWWLVICMQWLRLQEAPKENNAHLCTDLLEAWHRVWQIPG